MGRLTGKVAIVTGAASRGEGVGNGAATAILFAREGAKVVLVNRDAARGKSLEQQIRDEGGEAIAHAADVTRSEAAEAMAAFAVERYGRLDILHNNVGIGSPGTAETVDLGEWNKVFEANLTSALLYPLRKSAARHRGSAHSCPRRSSYVIRTVRTRLPGSPVRRRSRFWCDASRAGCGSVPMRF